MAWYDPRDWGIDDIPVLPVIGRNPIYNGPKPGARDFQGKAPIQVDDGPIGQLIPGAWGNPGGAQRQRKSGMGDIFSQPNPLEDLYRQLLERFNQSQSTYQSSYTGMSPEFMQGRANSIVDAQYNPQIDLIRGQISQAQTRADRNKGELGNMYAALSQAYEADVPRIQQMYDNAAAESAAQQQQLQAALAANYDSQANTVNREASALGQQAAAAEALAPMGEDEKFLTTLAGQIASQDQATLNQLEQNNVAYTQQGARLAGLEGNNRQADLMTQLEDYVNQQNSGIQTLENARGSDFAKLMFEMQMTDQERLAQESQNAQAFNAQQQSQNWQQLMDIAGIRMKMAEAQSQGQQQLDPADLIAAERLNFDRQNAIAKMVMDLLQSGKVKNLEEAMAVVAQTMGLNQ